ncbi:Butyrophilin-like protein 8 [Tupaia chinensis]|uniref:Butyrophilin-like protein 8 n=1 Tax=Tupaia chinensis TaxID=246437 RepID=L9KV95_TUPCH|nr:Butyrophilin-like protein 8 [Tupaia chinensis]
MLMLVLSLLKLGSGRWQVIGPDRTIQVLAGEDAEFSCFLSPEASAEAMEVRFFKDRFSAVVHLYKDGKDQENMKMPEYQRRTELVKDFLAEGRVSLRLKQVTPLDAGLYGCWFGSQTYEQEAFWELRVAELGSVPLISITGYVPGGVQLLCQSSGWFPRPQVKWKDSRGTVLPSDSKVNADRHGLFDVETSLTIQENSRNISCSIEHSDQSQEVESRVCVRDWEVTHGHAEWREAQKHTVEVTLDPDTAHPQFHISNLRAMCYRNVPQDVPQTEKRFTRKCVVATQAFQTGKHYWEVDVGCNEYWSLGVCRDDVDRRDKSGILSPNYGYWVLGLRADQNYFTINPSIINLSPKTPPRRVGIFLDYEGGAISFFNVNDESLIYTLTHPFHGLLRPYLEHQTYEGENPHPISICPVSLR